MHGTDYSLKKKRRKLAFEQHHDITEFDNFLHVDFIQNSI